MVEYTPDEIRSLGAQEVAIDALDGIEGVSVLRRLPIDRATLRHDKWMFLHTASLTLPLVIAKDQVMTFGTEPITACKYLKRVIEPGDMIDVALEPEAGGAYPLLSYWIHIEYVVSGSPPPHSGAVLA